MDQGPAARPGILALRGGELQREAGTVLDSRPGFKIEPEGGGQCRSVCGQFVRLEKGGPNVTEPITCNLAENALDYLLLAGVQAKEGSPRMLEHALATLADGVELLLKARLEMKDWCLVFKDVDQANRQKYEAGDFQSIVFEQAVKRLENICSVQIPNSHLAI